MYFLTHGLHMCIIGCDQREAVEVYKILFADDEIKHCGFNCGKIVGPRSGLRLQHRKIFYLIKYCERNAMLSKNYFIKATEEYNSFEKNVPAYYFRRAYFSPKERKVTLRIAACGFYELYFNREKITRGFLSPYISNPDDIVYYDEYEVTLREGENKLS